MPSEKATSTACTAGPGPFVLRATRDGLGESRANGVRAGAEGVLLEFGRAERDDAFRLADPGRQGHRAAHGLIGLLGVDAER